MDEDQDTNEVVELSDNDSDQGQDTNERRALFEPVVRTVVDALGGYEDGHYRLGDEAYGCLKDLKKLWRKDDTDDERTVARIFWESRVLPNDLVPILLATAGQGLVEDKRAIACVDLMTAMTWPIDLAEELKELDEELDRGSDYTQLLQSHLHYKAALLAPGVVQALLGIVLPPLAKSAKERTERDGQVVNVVLHLIRNMAFIKDLPVNTHLSADQAEFSALQTRLVRALAETHVNELLLTIASNESNDPLFNSWNALVLEIFYLLFRGVKPSSLIQDQAKQPAENLHRLLAAEERTRRDLARKATSRHSRFGTTISVTINPKKKTRVKIEGEEAPPEPVAGPSKPLVLHRQQAISSEPGSIMDLSKRQRNKKGYTVDELTREDNLSLEARTILQHLAGEFVEACFNPFLAALLKDIKSERIKITEKDNLRLLYVTKWFLEFFQSMRKQENLKDGEGRWGFGLIAEVTERGWIVWVLRRMREAVEEKPIRWTELQAGTECLTQLLLLIDHMSSTEIADPTLNEASEVLQQQLIYNGEILDIAFDGLRQYKEGRQSLAYLDASVHLAYVLLRILERWGKKGGDMYVRKKKARRRRRGTAGDGDGDGVPDVEIEEDPAEDEPVVHETMFTFEAFEMKFAQSEITHTLLAYLGRYRDFTSCEQMRRVVSLMHRQAVRAKAEGLFFKVSALDLFKSILADQKSLPREQPYTDAVNLINFILRQFFKALAAEPFLAIEAFFPKNRGHWKKYSRWEPPGATARALRAEDSRFPPDVVVKKGHSWSEQLGIVVAVLVERGERELVEWAVDILTLALAQRQRVIDETDGDAHDDENADDADAPPRGPSREALAKMTDYLVPYLSDEQAAAATRNAELKLLFRLAKLAVLDDNADELEWFLPAGIPLADVQRTRAVLAQFLAAPPALGAPAAALLTRARRRRRRARSPSAGASSADEAPRPARARRQKEQAQYKSAQFIDDSDAGRGDDAAFLAHEAALRARAAAAAARGGHGGAMKAAGTRKRRRAGEAAGAESKRRRRAMAAEAARAQSDGDAGADSGAGAESNAESASPVLPRPRPRPRPRRVVRTSDGDTQSEV